MKALLFSIVLLFSASSFAKDYFSSRSAVMSDSPACADVGQASSTGDFQGMADAFFCKKCKSGAKKKRVKLKRTTNIKDAYGKGKKDKQTDNHYRCTAKKVKEYVCAVKVGKTKAKAIRVKDGKLPKVGDKYAIVGTKLHSKSSKAKKDKACKVDKAFVCAVKKGKKRVSAVAVFNNKIPSKGDTYSIVGSKIHSKKSKAKKDPVCKSIVGKKYVCAVKVGKTKVKAVPVKDGKLPKVGDKYSIVGSETHAKKRDAKKDEACAVEKAFVCAVKKGKKKVIALAVLNGKIPAKGDKYDVVGTEVHSKKRDAKKDPVCKSTTTKQYVCAVKVGKKKVRAVLVKDGKLPEAGTTYSVVGTETHAKKRDAKKDKACSVESQFVCAIKKGKKRIKILTIVGSEAIPSVGQDYDVVGPVYATKKEARKNKKTDCQVVDNNSCFVCAELNDGSKKIVSVAINAKRCSKKNISKINADAKEAQNIKEILAISKKEGARKLVKACQPSSDLKCYVCDPSSGNAIELGENARSVGKGKMWDRLIRKKKSCSDLKRRQIKKALTKGKYLEVEKLLNDSKKYYTKGFMKNLTKEGKRVFKRVQKAPLFTSEEEALKYYGQIKVTGNKCAPKAEKCSDVFGNRLGETKQLAVNIGNFETNEKMAEAVKVHMRGVGAADSEVRPIVLSQDAKINGKDVKEFVYEVKRGDLTCYAKATHAPKQVLVCTGSGPGMTVEEKDQIKGKCDNINTELTIAGVTDMRATWDEQKCLCKLNDIKFKTKFDTCEFEFSELSFNGQSNGVRSSQTESKKDWKEVKGKVDALVSAIEVNAKAHNSCTLDIQGLASHNGLYANCVRYINEHKTGSKFVEKKHDAKSAEDINEHLGRLRALKLHQYIKAQAGQFIGDGKSCTMDHCGAVSKIATQVRTEKAIGYQIFEVSYTCGN